MAFPLPLAKKSNYLNKNIIWKVSHACVKKRDKGFC